MTLPTVTEILAGAGISPDYSQIEPAVLERARLRGILIDTLRQLDDRGDLDDAGLDESLVPYLAAWRKFKTDYGWEPRLHQVRCEYPGLYRGTCDDLGLLQGRPCVLEVKATSSLPLSAELQAAAYAEALSQTTGELRPVTQIAVVHLRRNGTYQPLLPDQQECWGVFQAAMRIYRWRQARAKGEMRRLAEGEE